MVLSIPRGWIYLASFVGFVTSLLKHVSRNELFWIFFQYSSPLGYVTSQRIIEKFELTCFCIVSLLWGWSHLCWNMFRNMPASIYFFCAVPVTWLSIINTIRILLRLCWNMCLTTPCLNILPIRVSSGYVTFQRIFEDFELQCFCTVFHKHFCLYWNMSFEICNTSTYVYIYIYIYHTCLLVYLIF